MNEYLLSLNFTSTAWITAAAGFVLLLEGTRRKKNTFHIISGFVLIMVAGLLRLHVLIAVGLLLIPALFIYARNEFKVWGTVIVLAAGLLFLLNIQHKNYYKKNIPGWEKQEAYRQALFNLSNKSENAVTLNSGVYGDSVADAFYKAKFFIDTGFISIAKLEQMGKDIKKQSRSGFKNLSIGLYWLFIELRVYLLLLGVCFFLLVQAGILKIFLHHWVIPLFIIAGAYFFLSVFMKMTFALHMGFMLILWIYSCEALVQSRSSFNVSKIKPVYFILLLVPFVWMGIRIYRMDADNKIKHQRFKDMVGELQTHYDKLFIATDDLLPMPFYAVWDVPSKNRISNLIYKDRVTTFSYQATAAKFQIKNMAIAIFTDSKIELLGSKIPELKKYYHDKFGVEIDYVNAADVFRHLKVYNFACISGCEKYAEYYK